MSTKTGLRLVKRDHDKDTVSTFVRANTDGTEIIDLRHLLSDYCLHPCAPTYRCSHNSWRAADPKVKEHAVRHGMLGSDWPSSVGSVISQQSALLQYHGYLSQVPAVAERLQVLFDVCRQANASGRLILADDDRRWLETKNISIPQLIAETREHMCHKEDEGREERERKLTAVYHPVSIRWEELHFIVMGISWRGCIHCPFHKEVPVFENQADTVRGSKHSGGGDGKHYLGYRYGSRWFWIVNPTTGADLILNDLQVHMLKDHLFFGGGGAQPCWSLNMPWVMDSLLQMSIFVSQPDVDSHRQWVPMVAGQMAALAFASAVPKVDCVYPSLSLRNPEGSAVYTYSLDVKNIPTTVPWLEPLLPNEYHDGDDSETQVLIVAAHFGGSTAVPAADSIHYSLNRSDEDIKSDIVEVFRYWLHRPRTVIYIDGLDMPGQTLHPKTLLFHLNDECGIVPGNPFATFDRENGTFGCDVVEGDGTGFVGVFCRRRIDTLVLNEQFMAPRCVRVHSLQTPLRGTIPLIPDWRYIPASIFTTSPSGTATAAGVTTTTTATTNQEPESKSRKRKQSKAKAKAKAKSDTFKDSKFHQVIIHGHETPDFPGL